jgi:hypothetical protein
MKKRLPLGHWTKPSKNISSEEKAPSLPAATSDEKSREHEAARLEALINSIDQIVLELDAEAPSSTSGRTTKNFSIALGANCSVEGPRIFSTRIFSALRTNSSGA